MGAGPGGSDSHCSGSARKLKNLPRRSCRATAARSLGGDSRGFKHRFQGSFCRLVPGRADSRPRGLESNGGRLPSVSRANGT